MEAAGLVRSMVFFTGTPHRGKDYGFFSLLHLLRPDLFDPDRPAAEQMPDLRRVMIRNNKQNVTDLGGRRLFRPTVVANETYAYSDEEQAFYAMLTEFILSGKAYANTLSGFEGTAVGLVLVAMQKLASSSVAAIRRALRGRLDRLAGARREVDQLRGRLDRHREAEGADDLDALARIEEEVAAEADGLALMVGEEHRLRELVAAAERVREETRIARIVALVESRFAGRSVLFFTEYKATQSLAPLGPDPPLRRRRGDVHQRRGPGRRRRRPGRPRDDPPRAPRGRREPDSTPGRSASSSPPRRPARGSTSKDAATP